MKVIRNFIVYTIKFALIGLSISGLICLGLWGSHSTCTNSCDGFEQCEIWCSNSCEDSCNSCFGAICGGTGGFIVGCADCGNCAPSCGMSCAKSCIDGCKKGGCDLGGCENLGFACEECGWSCEACGDGIKKDCHETTDDFKNDKKDTKRAKNFLMYITSIFAVIGAVFGLGVGIQETRKDIKAREAARKNEEEKARLEVELERKRKESEEQRKREEEESRRRYEEELRLKEEAEAEERQKKEEELWKNLNL